MYSLKDASRMQRPKPASGIITDLLGKLPVIEKDTASVKGSTTPLCYVVVANRGRW